MGALHAGHVSLFEAARAECELVVASLFVNEAQFPTRDDFTHYPRDEERDAQVAREAGVDVLFAPTADELYPAGFRTWVEPSEQGLEADFRPLRAYFAQQDAQHPSDHVHLLRVLNVDLELRVVPTVRDADGLALSSRNALLTPEERELALALPRALQTRDPARARELLDGVHVDYVEIAEFEPKVLAGAVRVGSTRLIDNVVLEGDPQ